MQAHVGVRKFMWPLLRADFELIETYQPPSLEPLSCDVTAIGARADRRYSPDQVGGATHLAIMISHPRSACRIPGFILLVPLEYM